MPLSADQRQKLEAEAKRRGIDPDKLIAAAERSSSASTARGGDVASPTGGDPPKLFQYHLPFVTVREVRQVWLGLTDAFPGDSAIAAEWAAGHGGDGPSPSTPAAAVLE